MRQSDITAASVEEKIRFMESVLGTDTVWDYLKEFAALAVDPAPEVRERALKAFWEHADPRYIDLLINSAREDPHVGARRAAITALGRYVYDGFVLEELDEADFNDVKTILLNIHQNPEEPLEARRMALEALGFITEQDIEDLIRAAYHHGDPQMRISALFAMGRSGTRTWDDILKVELHSGDRDMRFEAVRAAGEGYMQGAAETLEHLTDDPDRDIRLAAIDALGKAGRPHSKPVLRRLAISVDEDIRDTAAAALQELEAFESDTLNEGAETD